MTNVFAEYSRYYDLLYADKDYVGEAHYVASRLRQARPGLRRIVEFGSGTGRHGRLLARAGFEVAGIDRSADMLAQSMALTQSELPISPGSFAAIEGDIRKTKISGSCEAVVSLFHVVSYQTENDDLLAMLRNAARHLEPGGVFLFDVWYGPAVLTLRPENRVRRVGDDKLRVTRLAEPKLLPDLNCVDVNFEVFIEEVETGLIHRLQEQHRMRYFTTPEIALLAECTGFALVDAEEWLTGKKPSTDTWGVCYVLRRTGA